MNNTIKYIGYLREEVELIEWWKNNKPSEQNYADTLDLHYTDEFISHYALLGCFDKAEALSDPKSLFSHALTGYSNDYTARELYDWVQTLSDNDRKKACLYLAKLQNKERLEELGGITKGKQVYNEDEWNKYYSSELTDFESLPMQEVFIQATSKQQRSIESESVYGFLSFTQNKSIYEDIYSSYSYRFTQEDNSELMKWILLPNDSGDVSIQITPYSYTQCANPKLTDLDESGVGSNVNVFEDVIYFSDGEAKKANVQSDKYFDNIEPLEAYALDIQNNSTYKIEDINIKIMLDRSRSAAKFTQTFTNRFAFGTRSLSYKLVFDITKQKSVFIPSVDLYQSLLYLQSMNTEDVSLYYDDAKKRIIIKGKSYSGTVVDYKIKEGSRLKQKVERTVEIPTFAIIYEQPIEDLTRFVAVEYVQFFDKELSFRDKYDLLHSKLNTPLELPEEFTTEYPYVADSYAQQVDVALSTKGRDAKFEYVKDLAETYLDSYTELEIRYKIANDKGEWNGKWTTSEKEGIEGSKQIFRKSIVSDEWLTPNYVLTVNEAYWQYNDNMSLEEILSFFVSKGNDAGYRILAMKIIGVDYYLFEQSIINGLLTTNDIYVSKMELDETNITADVQYQSLNGFVSGNIYRKYENITQEGENTYSEKLQTFFGSDLGSSLYDTSLTTINDAIENRHIPTLVPKVADDNLAKALELNVDIYNPIFFTSTENITNSGTVPSRVYDTVLSTAQYSNRLNIELKVSNYNSQSSNWNYGHFDLFENWLKSNEALILGTYNAREITDAYIFPKQPDIYIRRYILPLFKDESGTVVGFKWDGGATKLKDIVDSADEITRLYLKSLERVKDSENLTRQEKKSIVDGFKVAFKERYWEARREGRRLFNLFLRNEITVESQKEIDFLWNKTYNNYAKPDLFKVPMFPTHSYMFGKRAEANKLVLAEAQKEGIRHVLSRKNSGLFLHEVGFGKTTSSITAISSMMNTGDTSRALFLVPNSVYDKFQDEIVGNSQAIGLLPNVNIVLLDNLSATTLKNTKSNNGKGLKVFTAKELEAMKEFRAFARNFGISKKSEKGESPVHLGNQCRLFSALKRHRVTLDNDPIFTAASDWSAAKKLIDSAFKKEVKSMKNNPIILSHLAELDSIKDTVQAEWNEKFADLESIINDWDKAQSAKDKAQSQIDKLAVTYSNKLSKMINQYIRFADLSLVDDLGYYKPQVMQEKTILVAKHTAVSQLRPSQEGLMRALMFKEGKGEPLSTPNTLNLGDWADATGEDTNTRLTQEKVKVAVKVLSTHPISYDKLGIDTLVIDEIHNFNNIVNRAGAKGFNATATSGNNTDFYTGDKRSSGNRKYPLITTAGRGANTYAMKYDSTGRGSDGNGTKLTAAALCFDIQSKKENVNNVLLLSATPFTDTPYQVLSVLGMSNYDMLIDNGMTSAWDFFNNYVDEIYKYDLRHDGGYGLFIDVNGYYNDKALSNLITNVANVKITDEKIEANRPKKAIIPANKMKKADDGTASTASPQMGDQFSELELCNSRVELNESQQKFQKIINDYLADDDNQEKVTDIFPINETRRNKKGLTEEEEAELDEALKVMMAEKLKEAKEDPDVADLVLGLLEDMYNRSPQYKQHPLIKKTIDNINKSVFGVQPEVDEDDLSDATADTNQMTDVQRLAGKAISCQQAQQSLVLSPYMVNLGDKAYTSKFLEPLEPNPSKVFVENSPKLLFVVKSISQTLKYQQEQVEKGLLEKVGGQVIYFHKHNFSYGGKTYNAFDLLAEYLANNVAGLSSDKGDLGNYVEIAQISGNTKIEDSYKGKGDKKKLFSKGRKTIKDEFNDGTIKVLIGSKAIKEGIDLQGNSHTMYICEAEFSPEVAMQLEGRIWRQKNPYDVVRVIYVLAMNTIDSFIYSKINRKVTMIKRMLELGVYEMGTTQFVVDTKEMLIQLESDPDKLTAIQFQDEIKILKEFVDTKEKLMSRLEYVKSDYADVSSKYETSIDFINQLYKMFGEIRMETRKDKVRLELTKALSPQKKLDYEAAKKKGSKLSIGEWAKKLTEAQKAKYKAKEADVDTKYLEEITENPNFNPFPNWENIVLSVETPFSELQIAAQKVIKNLKVADQFETTWRRASQEERDELRAKEKAPINQRLYIAYFDVIGDTDNSMFQIGLNKMFELNAKNINCIKDYQSYILNNEEANGFEDIDKVLEKEGKQYYDAVAKTKDEDKFKAELRASWVKALKERKEVFGGTLEDLVDTMEGSLPLIKFRKK